MMLKVAKAKIPMLADSFSGKFRQPPLSIEPLVGVASKILSVCIAILEKATTHFLPCLRLHRIYKSRPIGIRCLIST